jgi:hypothetical protein
MNGEQKGGVDESTDAHLLSDKALNEYFQMVYDSPEYKTFLARSFEAEALQNGFGVLTPDFVRVMDAVGGFAVFWNLKEQIADVVVSFLVPQTMLEDGQLLLGFAELDEAGERIGRAIPLPIYSDQERVRRVMLSAL